MQILIAGTWILMTMILPLVVSLFLAIELIEFLSDIQTKKQSKHDNLD